MGVKLLSLGDGPDSNTDSGKDQPGFESDSGTPNSMDHLGGVTQLSHASVSSPVKWN